MTSRAQLTGLPAVAVVLVGGVLALQLNHGGGTFEPLASADPCAARTVTSQADGIDGLTERLVLLGLDGAACRLGVSREALTLELAQPGPRTDEEIDALHDGLLSAVQQMKDDGTKGDPDQIGQVEETHRTGALVFGNMVADQTEGCGPEGGRAQSVENT